MSANTYWFLGLSLISVIILIVMLVKKDKTTIFLMLMTMTQIAYLIETVIYIFLDAYRYYPKIISSDAFYDSNMGALTSNMFIVPTLATVIGAFRLRWRWILVFIALLAVVEWLFLNAHVYTHNWWKTGYTSTGLLVYFPISLIVYRRLLRPASGWLHHLLLFLSVAPIMGTLHIIPIMLFLNRSYHPGWFAEPGRETTAFSAIYYVASTLCLIGILMLKWRRTWPKYALLAAFYSGVTVVLQWTGLLSIHTWWDPIYFTLFPLGAYFVASRMSKRLKQGSPHASGRKKSLPGS
ncbi:hypothetical protein [Paenibacillus soyae]|uniref:Uncharacterized protein n=1 Tax=Paenibacillus soyae TaxID=2969249 RepID=A0A9X2MT52_9BACL|nr:hypothetical protein [Paenibacillus soyae]MCR2805980.1 hypothetical protein [Paenibacillus soyae]